MASLGQTPIKGSPTRETLRCEDARVEKRALIIIAVVMLGGSPMQTVCVWSNQPRQRAAEGVCDWQQRVLLVGNVVDIYLLPLSSAPFLSLLAIILVPSAHLLIS
jgi:hypothetical protein